MADQIKEISNGTYFIGALSNGVSIAGTDANTQHVVKDIYVQDNELIAVGGTLDFVVNGVNVADIDASVTGSEIIDVSSTAVAVATASFTNDVLEYFGPLSGTGGKATSLSVRKVNGVQGSAVATQSAAISTALSQASGIQGQWFVGSDFFYLYDDSNSSQTLYRRVGGINGTQNVVFTGAYNCVVFNGVDKFHQVQASVIQTYVPATNTTTSVTIQTGGNWTGTVNSYPRISFANGLVFWYNSVNANGFAINPTTGYNTRISNIAVIASGSDYTPLAVYYSGSTYYYLSVNNSTTAGVITIRYSGDFGPLTSASISTTGTALVYTSPTAQITGGFPLPTPWPSLNYSTGDWVWLKSYSANVFTFGCINIPTQTIKSNIVLDTNLTAPAITGSSNIFFKTATSSDDSANKTNTTFYPQTATLRVTGVQTTP